MKINVTKIALYVVLIALILFCGSRFLSRYSTLMSTEINSDPYESAEILKPTRSTEFQNIDTNELAEAGEEGNGDNDTGLVDEPDDLSPEESEAEAQTAGDEALTQEQALATKRSYDRGEAPDVSGIGLYVVSLFGLVMGLGILAAHDISTFMGQRTHKLLHNEEGEGVYSASYDAAEETWAKGEYLDAVRMMREYLDKNPREVHVMIRIAEIYEKDLGNFLAAALEYEELLKKKLPKERWGWAAIHLVNLYFGKIDKPKMGIDLLYRIHREYGQTAAAGKARKRLLQLDPGFQAELDLWEAEQSGDVVDEYEEEYDPGEESAAAYHPPEESDPNMPKGFRKKR